MARQFCLSARLSILFQRTCTELYVSLVLWDRVFGTVPHPRVFTGHLRIRVQLDQLNFSHGRITGLILGSVWSSVQLSRINKSAMVSGQRMSLIYEFINFVRVLKRVCFLFFWGNTSTLGGERQRGNSILFRASSAIARCTGKWRSYLEPNSGSLQKPIEGRGRIETKRNQNHAETRVYLEPNRNGMHEPIEGRSRHQPNSNLLIL
jgi:hypothetical protein